MFFCFVNKVMLFSFNRSSLYFRSSFPWFLMQWSITSFKLSFFIGSNCIQPAHLLCAIQIKKKKYTRFVQIVVNENSLIEMKGKTLEFGYYRQNFTPRSVSSISRMSSSSAVPTSAIVRSNFYLPCFI